MLLWTQVVLALGLFQGVSVSAGEGFSRRDVFSRRDLKRVERAIEERSWASKAWDAIEDAATCTGCQAVLLVLKGIADLGNSDFVDILQDVCKLSGAEDDDVCDGAIALEGPIIASALRNMTIGSKTADEFCITFLGLCEYPAIDAWAVPFPSAKPSGGRPAPSGQDPIKVVHYSDIHVDPQYETGANADCSKPICCRPYTEADEPGNNDDPAGPNGNHNCDAPISLEDSMYAAIQSIVPDAAFTLFTGDIVDHGVWNTSQSYNTEQINNAYAKMDDTQTLVYGTAGNHEMSPANAFQPTSVGNGAKWVYDLLSTAWTDWIGTEATAETDSIGAYSTVYPGGNLRIISLNTNLYYRDNYWLYQKSMLQDPSGQFAWLVTELDAAEQAGENVYIIGHMPMGNEDAFHDPSNYFDQIVNRYSATIAAMFFGHTHVDEFQISYSDYSNRQFSNALAMSYVGPSLTPTSGMPSFRVYDVDPVTFGVLDVKTYMADMNNSAYQTTGPVWTEYYSAKEAYGSLLSPAVTDASAELTPAFWHNVTSLMESDDDVFEAFLLRKSRGWTTEDCTGDCKTEAICALRAARAQDNCYTPSPGINFSKRMENQVRERDECGISVTRATLGAMVKRREALEALESRFVEAGARLKM